MYAAAKIELEKCIGCKLCILSCPEPNVLLYLPETKQVSVNQQRCKGCGLCVVICPKDALSVSSI